MRKLMFATNINGTEETGIVDVKSQRVFCLCTKDVADEILKNLGQSSLELKEVNELQVLFKKCFVAGEEFKVGVDNTISNMEKRLPYNKEDMAVKNFNQWYSDNEAEILKTVLGKNCIQ